MKIDFRCTGYVLALFLVAGFSIAANAQINFPLNSSYKYLKGNNAQGIGSNWVNSTYNDASWEVSNAPFRYGDGQGGTELTDMRGAYSTLFLRTTFTASNVAQINELILRADYDDGFALFINGNEVARSNAPYDLVFDALSTDLHEYGEMQTFRIDGADANLQEGENSLAVFCCNTTLAESSDFYFDMALSGALSLPELPELTDTVSVDFNKESGFYDANFTLNISTPEDDGVIVYTLDGSNPQTSSTLITGSQSVSVVINPSSNANRGITPGVVVRAAVKKTGFKASKPVARTFIFSKELTSQSTNPGWDWPTYNINGQEIDLGMDTRISQGTQYGSKMEEAMTQIPTISVVTDNANLFDAIDGIYVNAMSEGKAWERECSVELINPDGTEGFGVNAGIRIRGGYSRNPFYPRHGFRLFFREEYGNSKLHFPLFDNEGVDKFDKVDLRCAQNYAWSNGDNRHTYVREVFNRDTQGKMGQLYTRSRYYHLYLNGMYWGIYQTQERAEARFAASYLGGDVEDYDVIKVGGGASHDLDATDGNLNKWKEVWNIAQQGFAKNANYFKIQGKDEQGRPVNSSEVLVEIDNLIDYMINIFYTGNFDSPVSKWGGNKTSNNFYIINNREDKSTGFQFLVHDSEHTMVDLDGTPAINVNRVNIGELNDENRMEVWNFSQFHPQWLHHKLSENIEYRTRFADRAYKHFQNNGLYTAENNIERFNRRVDEIDMAIIGESARWGDTRGGQAYTKDNAWIPELNKLRNNYFPYRTEVVEDQLYDLDLYAKVAAPILSLDGENIEEEYLHVNDASNITFSSSSGDIYYTTNGNDPRAIGGSTYLYAQKIANGSSVNFPSSAIINVRVLKNNKWSALRKVNLVNTANDWSHFKVTELHFHPLDSVIGADTVEASNYEYIEFKNTSYDQALNLSGVVIDSAINFEFPSNTLLAPQQYFVVAAKPKKYYDRYGLLANGNFSKSFKNGGERIQVRDINGNTILDFVYDDEAPWPEVTDGKGPSLVSIYKNPTGDPNRPVYWTSSSKAHGSPGITDPASIENPSSVAYADVLSVNIYPNPTQDFIHVISNASAEVMQVELYNMNGAILYSDEFVSTATLSLASLNLNFGVFMLKVRMDNEVKTQKLIYTP